jgi:hypothetical protein
MNIQEVIPLWLQSLNPKTDEEKVPDPPKIDLVKPEKKTKASKSKRTRRVKRVKRVKKHDVDSDDDDDPYSWLQEDDHGVITNIPYNTNEE